MPTNGQHPLTWCTGGRRLLVARVTSGETPPPTTRRKTSNIFNFSSLIMCVCAFSLFFTCFWLAVHKLTDGLIKYFFFHVRFFSGISSNPNRFCLLESLIRSAQTQKLLPMDQKKAGCLAGSVCLCLGSGFGAPHKRDNKPSPPDVKNKQILV